MRKAIVFSALLATSPALAHEYKVGDLTIDHPISFETPKNARAGGGYMMITNAGDAADKLVEVRADFPQVMIHLSTVDDQGVARMEHVMALDIPAGETVELKPGGYHVMFMGLNGDPLEEGETIPATLVFEKAGEIEVVFKVEKRKHGSHDH
ncbi:MAG: copper chaperone PCu(A)C [Pseudomonadota bacterium]